MSEINIEHHEEESNEDGSTERDLGKVENEVEHHTEAIEEQADTIESLKNDKEWLQSEISRLEQMITAAPEAMRGELQSTIERLEKLENKETEAAASLTTLPPPEAEPSSRTNQSPAKRSPLHRWL